MAQRDSWTCPHCGEVCSSDTVRTINQNGAIVRYRKCHRCKANFKTIERLYNDDLKAIAVARLFDLRVPADKILEVIGSVPIEVVIRYLDALPAFAHDRAKRNDPIRSPSGFICWAIMSRERIPPMAEPEKLPQRPDIDGDRDREPESHDHLAAELWRQALTELKWQMTDETFDRWLRGSVGVERKNGHLLVSVHDEYAQEWCSTRLIAAIQRTINDLDGNEVNVIFQVQERPAEP